MVPKFLRPIGLYLGYYYHITRPLRSESSTSELYSSYVSENDVVLEVGARIGAGTRILSILAKKVYAFEPNPYSFRILKHNMKHAKNVILFREGLGDKEGEAWLYVGEDASRTTPSDSMKKIFGVRYSKTVRIQTATIDDVNWDPIPTCIVLDCEGFEKEVLLGGQRILSSGLVKTILVETHTLQDSSTTLFDVKNELSKYAYELTDYKDADLIPWVIASKS